MLRMFKIQLIQKLAIILLFVLCRGHVTVPASDALVAAQVATKKSFASMSKGNPEKKYASLVLAGTKGEGKAMIKGMVGAEPSVRQHFKLTTV